MTQKFRLPLAALLGALGIACLSGLPAPAQENAKPRLLVLPWLVVDRNTNRECTRPESAGAPLNGEARRLAQSAQSTLDAAMHRQGTMEMIPRKEWAPHWQGFQPGTVFRQGAGCAVCNPAGELLRYDPAAVQGLAQAVRADYAWLGVTVVPLTAGKSASPPDDCCREALGQGRNAVLARSSVVLVRASDGAVVWQRDARRLEGEVPYRIGKINRSPDSRRAIAVDSTAKLLAGAFRREHREALR